MTQTVQAIVDTIGRRKLADEMGVTTQFIGKIVKTGRFPATWYFAMREVAGCDLPLCMFGFKETRAGSATR